MREFMVLEEYRSGIKWQCLRRHEFVGFFPVAGYRLSHHAATLVRRPACRDPSPIFLAFQSHHSRQSL